MVTPRSLVLRGLAFPFRREATDFATAESTEQVKQDIAMVLTTPRGTLAWRPEFGSDLHRLRHANPSTALRAAEAFVGRALERWVPSVRLQRVTPTINAHTTGTALSLSVVYRIVSGPLASTTDITQDITV